jgi:hypothetical protein
MDRVDARDGARHLTTRLPDIHTASPCKRLRSARTGGKDEPDNRRQ